MEQRGQGGSALKKRRTKQKTFAKLLDIKQSIQIFETRLGEDVLEQRSYPNVDEELLK